MIYNTDGTIIYNTVLLMADRSSETSIRVPLKSGHSVNVMFHPVPECSFGGRKLQHPFELTEVTETWLRRGKPVHVRGLIYGDTLTAETTDQLFSPKTKFFVKFDGSCGEIRSGAPRRRHDLKVSNNEEDPLTKVGDLFASLHYQQCESRPVIPEGKTSPFHWPHMRDIVFSGKEMGKMGDKWYAEAGGNILKSAWYERFGKSFTHLPGEWMGPKLQMNRTDPLDVHTFIPFNMVEFEIPPELRTQKGFHEIFTIFPNIEGLVAYCPDQIFKIRRDMFRDEGKRLEWGKTAPDSIPPELKERFDSVGARNFAEFLVKVFGL